MKIKKCPVFREVVMMRKRSEQGMIAEQVG